MLCGRVHRELGVVGLDGFLEQLTTQVDPHPGERRT